MRKTPVAPNRDSSMQPRTRMFTTLVCLAVAMTACAILLAWIEPPSPAQTVLTDPGFPRTQAAEAIAIDPDAAPASWREIELFITPRRAATLAAKSTSAYHFSISQDGLVRATPAWRGQRSIGGRAGQLRVGVTGPVDGAGIPLTQWIGLRALIRLLSHELASTGATLPIRVGSSPADPGREVAAELQRRLRFEGFSTPPG